MEKRKKEIRVCKVYVCVAPASLLQEPSEEQHSLIRVQTQTTLRFSQFINKMVK